MRKYYPGITLFKLLGSLLVLMGHVHVPQLFHDYGRFPGLQQAANAIVPGFYMVSGFLAYKGWASATRSRVYIYRYLGGLATIYVACSVLAWLLGDGARAVYGAGAWHNRVLPLANVYLVVGPYGALWFIPPLLAGVVFCYYFERRGWLKGAVVLTGVGFATAQLLAGTFRVVAEAAAGSLALYHWRYSDLLKQAVINYLGLSLPFILAGVLIARREAAFVKLPGWRLAGLALGSLGLEMLVLKWLALAKCDWSAYRLILSILPLGIWLFYGVLHIRDVGFSRYRVAIHRFSALLYFLHMPLMPGALATLGLSMAYLGRQLLTTSQIVAVMLLIVLQVALLTWVVGLLLARRPRPAAEATEVASILGAPNR